MYSRALNLLGIKDRQRQSVARRWPVFRRPSLMRHSIARAALIEIRWLTNSRLYILVVIAAPSCVWELHDQLAPLGAAITIAHPQLASLMPALRARDVIALAQLHAAGLAPALWTPPPEVRNLRALTAQRRRLLDQRSAARTLLHELLRRYRLTPPSADRLAADRPDWWETRELAPNDRLRPQAA
jgi:hypothetical protein